MRRLIVAGLLTSVALFAKEEITPPCTIGNFALPGSQQPGPFISFGQNIIDQYELQFYLSVEDHLDCHRNLANFIPNVLYGITDALSMFFNMPIAVYQDETNRICIANMEEAFEGKK